ncbi:MAG: putative rane protein [Mucilaginibacter sp.]|nr:putative rane protein [Mucilaginibacter sp.]
MQTIDLISRTITGLVALIHCYIMWLEMFAWTTRGPKAFNKSVEELEKSKTLAANQGLYNGFLAAGLIWTFFIRNYYWQNNISLFFLICVTVAGVYGALTVTRKIFYIQSVPAILAIALILVNR